MKKTVFYGLLCLLLSGIHKNAAAQDKKYIDSLVTVLKTAPDDTNKVRLLDELSYEQAGNSFKDALEYANQELELSQKLSWMFGISAGYNSIGIAYKEKGEYAIAMEYFMKSLKVKEQMGSKRLVAEANNSIANVYIKMGFYDKALEYLFKVLAAKDLINLKESEGNTYTNIGICYKNKKEYEKALKYQLMALEIRKQIGVKKNIAASHNNIGTTYMELKQYDKCIAELEEGLKIRMEINDLSGIGGSNLNIGEAYNRMKKYKEALPYIKEGEKYCLLAGNDEWRINAYSNFVDSYDGLKDYKMETQYLMKYIALNDSVFNKEKSGQILDMQTKYETEKKESENKLLTQQNQIQQLQLSRSNYFIGGISIVLLCVIAIGLLFIRQSRLNAQQRNMQLEQKLLRSQMNPHFIFNSLIAIESYIYKNEPKEAGKYLSNFARLMRLILENSREEYIPLAKEIKTLEYYLQLQKNRFDDTFEYSIELADDIDPEAIAIPPMLAQPFIENSIEHGLKNISKKGEIKILFRLKDGQLMFEVKDNGIGLEQSLAIKEQNKEHKSMATVITMERLSALNRRKRKKIRLLIDELKDSVNNVMGTQVSFAIPFKEI